MVNGVTKYLYALKFEAEKGAKWKDGKAIMARAEEDNEVEYA